MKQFKASLCSGVLLALAAIHVYWATGGQRFAEASVPTRTPTIEGSGTPLFVPGPISTLGVAAGLTGAAVVVARAGFAARQRGLANLVALAFLLRAVGEFRYVGFSKRVRGTEFSRRDDLIYSPLCLGVSVLARGAAK